MPLPLPLWSYCYPPRRSKKEVDVEKATPINTLTGATPPIDLSLNDILLTDLFILLLSGTLMVEGSRDLLDSVTFAWSIAPLKEQLVGLDKGLKFVCRVTFSASADADERVGSGCPIGCVRSCAPYYRGHKARDGTSASFRLAPHSRPFQPICKALAASLLLTPMISSLYLVSSTTLMTMKGSN